MMNFISRSHNRVNYDDTAWYASQTVPGVRFAVRKVSLAGRMELFEKVRELCLKYEFLRTGDHAEQSEAMLAELLLQKLYLEWGFLAIEGFTINGAAASIDSLIASGPEILTDEIVSHIRSELGLTDEERKNS